MMKGSVFMLCEKCGKNNATVMYTQIINGQKRSLNICSVCASKESIFDNFGSLLSFGTRESSKTTVCPLCNTTLSEFMHKGKAGCGECYRVFRPQATAMLKKIHTTTKHIADNSDAIGKAEKTKRNEPDELSKLKEALKKEIEEENFEQAAVIRDKIKALESGRKEDI